jgi:hypothetical protein
MPRKAVAKAPVDTQEPDSGNTDGPRRSTRISSQPGQQDHPTGAQVKKTKGITARKTISTKKRSLNDEEPSEQAETTEAAKPKKVSIFVAFSLILHLTSKSRLK